MLMKTFFLRYVIPAAWCLLFAFAVAPLYGQTTMGGTTPNASAELDVQSTSRGMLPPRLTTAQRNAIVNPATGLLIFNTTLNCVEMNIGTPTSPAWGCFNTTNTVTAASATPTVCRNAVITPITHTTTGATGIGTATGLPSGLTATWASNTITISGTPTAAGTFNYSIPLTGGLGSAQATGTITVAFNTVSAATSIPVLPINTALTPITLTTTGATGIGTPTGLPAGVTASWASNTITISGTPTVSGTLNYTIPLTGGCGSVNATGTIVVEPADCGAFIAAGVWKTFKCHNLGASLSADPFTPSWRLNGNYYQWGIKSIAGAAPTDGTTIAGANIEAITGWNTTAAANDAWSDASKTSNDPCPTGMRLPTSDEWGGVMNPGLNPSTTSVGTWTISVTNYTSGLLIGSVTRGLFLPAAGLRSAGNGSLSFRGLEGHYWSSTQGGNSTNAVILNFDRLDRNISTSSRTLGASVRCISQ